jgi:hypothetical protein
MTSDVEKKRKIILCSFPIEKNKREIFLGLDTYMFAIFHGQQKHPNSKS